MKLFKCKFAQAPLFLTFEQSFMFFSYRKPGLWIRIRMDPHSFSLLDPDPHSICGSGSRGKILREKKKKISSNVIVILLKKEVNED